MSDPDPLARTRSGPKERDGQPDSKTTNKAGAPDEPFVPLLSFTPGGFFGYATMFSVHAAGVTAFGVSGLAGETLAALASMLIGAAIGLGTERLADATS